MKNTEQYKKRFFNLIESTIGNIKPLLTESLDDDQKNEYKAKHLISINFYKMQPALKYLTSASMYKTAIDKNEVIDGNEESDVIDMYQIFVNKQGIDKLIDLYDEKYRTGGDSSELDNSPTEPEKIEKPNDGAYSLDLDIENGNVTQISRSGNPNLERYKKLTEENKTKYQFCKQISEGEICLVEVSKNDGIAQGKLTSTKNLVISFGYKQRDSIEGRINIDGEDKYIHGSILKPKV